MTQASLQRRAAPAFDLSGVDLNQMARQALQPWADAYDSWRSSVDELTRSRTTPKAKSCGCTCGCTCDCAPCQPDDCACRCCVTDADLVVEARVGERRIIPIVIENAWRRERDVELELSTWTAIAGAEVTGQIEAPTSFKLAPCGRENVVLIVEIAAAAASPTPGKAAGRGAAATQPPPTERQAPDVSRCEVAYADLRIIGCDMRSIRIAVAVLPRTCSAYVANCGCACCC
jgi:hypothetical protein